jgi:hypothetical protein
MVKHRESTKWRAIDVAVFVLGLQIEKMKIEKGEASYRKFLPDDVNWFERYANEMSLSKARSIYRQAAAAFEYKDTKQIQRLLRLVEREGWHRQVVDKYEHDLAAEISTAARNRRREARDELMMALLSPGVWRTF